MPKLIPKIVMNPSKTSLILSAVFIVSLLVSVVVHLPAAWVLNQPEIKSTFSKPILKTKQVQLGAINGSVWQGSTRVKLHDRVTKQQVDVGQVSWSFKPMSLVWLDLAVDLQWKYADSTLKGELSSNVMSAKEQLKLSDLTGELVMQQVVGLLNLKQKPSAAMLQNMQGQVKVEGVNTTLDIQKAWPTALSGQLTITNLDVMENRFPTITVRTGLNEQRVQASLLSEAPNWNLTGDVFLMPNSRYQSNLVLKAQDEQSLPDWAFLMRKKSPTHYVSQLTGRF